MVTTKVQGCGGRYSYLKFCPCERRLINRGMSPPKIKRTCEEQLKRFRTEKHYEWWTVR
jgi:hypothetical protein